MHQATASDLPFYDISAPQKVTFSKISDDVIACDLWFGPPPIKNPGYAYEATSREDWHPLAKVANLRLALLRVQVTASAQRRLL